MQRERIGDLCRGRWHSILTGLGVADAFLSGKHGPCPICQNGKDRWRWDNKDGRGSWFCSHCGAGDGFNFLQRLNGWTFVQAAKEVERVLGMSTEDAPRREFDDKQKAEALRRVWRESKPVTRGDAVWTYLNRRTGIEQAPACLRFHANLRYDADRSFAAMLAVVTMPDDTASTMHRTWLDGRGGKAPVETPKKVMHGTIKTGAIRLFDVSPLLGIAEGIETALRASVRFSVPVWAAISAGGMRDWEPPKEVSEVVVFGDNDANFTGQSAAYALANKLELRGIKTMVRIPEKIGTDWADE